jgi:phosphopantothenoylcysteine decarboxylase/phosphopantothenate--cysteine ligase
MFSGKTVVLGVTGGIAAYKACEVARALVHRGIAVHVVMTRSATEFVSPLTFQTLTGNTVHTEMFNLLRESEIGHIALARRGDVILIAPATANFIGKVASGIADDLLSTVVMAARVPVLFAPAMNTAMWENRVVQRNLDTLRTLGYGFVEPKSGELACGEEGRGKLADVGDVLDAVYSTLTEKLFAGRKLVVDAGPTREHLDPVRFLSNRSSGKMGYAVARVASWMGAEVTLIAGPTDQPDPAGVRVVRVETAAEMLGAVRTALPGASVMIAAAAVADFSFAEKAKDKLKKEDVSSRIQLVKTNDILVETRDLRSGMFTVGFAAETARLADRAQEKMTAKGLDMICANDVSRPDIGFDADHNEVQVFFRDGRQAEIFRLPKEAVADRILRLVAESLPKP